MNENGFQFRTATFGGFQKQDVMNYLERSAKEHAEKLAALQKELAEEKLARAEGEDRAAAQELRLAALEEENRRLAGQLSDKEERLRQVEGEREDLRTLSDQLQDQLDKVLPAATAYEAVKDRTASIELEAHGRAQAIEREGRERAQRHQEQVKDWFAKTRQAYDRLRTDLSAATAQLTQELDRAGQGIRDLTAGLTDRDAALDAIQAQIEALDSAAPPQPHPPDGQK